MKIFNIKNYIICVSITILLVILRLSDPFFIEIARLKGIDFYQQKQETLMNIVPPILGSLLIQLLNRKETLWQHYWDKK